MTTEYGEVSRSVAVLYLLAGIRLGYQNEQDGVDDKAKMSF